MTNKPDEKITAAQAGELIKIGSLPERVLQPCADKHGGNWHCLTHKKSFANQLQKDGHIHAGRHRLVWLCHQHGPEQGGT